MHPPPDHPAPAAAAGDQQAQRGELAPQAEAAQQVAQVQVESAEHIMQCMEVWGGNAAIDATVKMPGLSAWVYSRPYKGEEAGGDVHYVSSCGTGRITRLLVADVSGHGANVAALASKLRDLMRRYVNYLDQTAFVKQLNREFAQVATLGKFATAIVATYFASSGCLVASNAGHPRPLWYSARTRTWEILKDKVRPDDDGSEGSAPAQPSGQIANLPFGIDDVADYDQLKVWLHPGDLLIIYTDSLMEAIEAGTKDHSRMLGEEGLLEIAKTLDPSKPREFVAQLIDRVVAYSGGIPPGDDVTVLALSANTGKSRASLRGQLGAAWEFVLALAMSWRPGAPPVPWPELSVANVLGALADRFGRNWGGPKKA